MKVELEVKIDGESFYHESADETLTRGPDGKWNVREPLTPKMAQLQLHLMMGIAKYMFDNTIVSLSDVNCQPTEDKGATV